MTEQGTNSGNGMYAINVESTEDARALAASAPPFVAGGANPPGTLYTVEGDGAAAGDAIGAAARKVDRTYTVPYVSHACMEVLNCTVDYVAGQRR